MAPLSPRPAARRLSARCAKTPTGGSVAQWIAHWTSRGLKGFKGSGFESRRSRVVSFTFFVVFPPISAETLLPRTPVSYLTAGAIRFTGLALPGGWLPLSSDALRSRLPARPSQSGRRKRTRRLRSSRGGVTRRCGQARRRAGAELSSCPGPPPHRGPTHTRAPPQRQPRQSCHGSEPGRQVSGTGMGLCLSRRRSVKVHGTVMVIFKPQNKP